MPTNTTPSEMPIEDKAMTAWTLARRANVMNPSVLREILKVTERPDIISFAGGFPAQETFPVDAFAVASQAVLAREGHAALQYAASEGYRPLRETVANMLPWNVDPDQVLITNGSQQCLDLVAKVLIDPGSRVLVESPTYVGALQAFSAMEPSVVGVAGGDEGLDLEDLAIKAHPDGASGDRARLLYIQPNFQNPTGRTMCEAGRTALSRRAAELNLPIAEDNPYGELWFEAPPPLPLAARNPDGCIYIGSFSKVLAPGMRLGFLVAPSHIYPKLLQAKQAADLHTSGFAQRMVWQVMQDGFLERHLPLTRAIYKLRRDLMLSALTREMKGLDVTWNCPSGGMFLWARLPAAMDAQDLFPLAIAKGVAFVPGAPFFAQHPDLRSLRLCFVTSTEDQIARGIAALAQGIGEIARQRSSQRSVNPGQGHTAC